MTMEEKSEGCNMAGFDDGRRDHESRNASEQPLEAGKAKETNDQLQPPERNAALPTPSF